MQTAEEVEKHVPIREGDYGEKVATVEPGGVEYIALRERHGKPLDVFFVWVSPNLEFATIFVGTIAIILFGLNLWEAATAIIVGTAIGSLTHAVVSSWGPKFGVPMMVESRGAFGFLGNILPAGLNAFTGAFGWFIVNSVSGAFALLALVGAPNSWFWLGFLVIVVAQVLVATLGHNLIHFFERWSLPLLGIVFAVACLFIFSKGNYGVAFNPKAPLAFGGDTGGWILAFTAAFGYAAGWNPYASDYTRYMPPGVDRRMVGFWAGFGVFISCIVLELAGAVLATVAGTKWGANDIPTAQLQQAMPNVVYYLTLLCIAVGAVAANHSRDGPHASPAPRSSCGSGRGDRLRRRAHLPGAGRAWRQVRSVPAPDLLLDRAVAGGRLRRLLAAQGRLRGREPLLRHAPSTLAGIRGHGHRPCRLGVVVREQLAVRRLRRVQLPAVRRPYVHRRLRDQRGAVLRVQRRDEKAGRGRHGRLPGRLASTT